MQLVKVPAHKRGLSLGKFAETYMYRQVWKLEVDTKGILMPINFFAAIYRYELQVQSRVG